MSFDGFTVYVTDTETTGLLDENEVIEISAARVRFGSKVEVDQKTWYLRALNPASIQDEALKVNGHKREDILHMTVAGREKYRLPTEVIAEIELWVMDDDVSALDRVLVGHNPGFDIRMMENLWKAHGKLENFPFMLEKGNRTLDTKQLLLLIDLCTGRRRKYFNLTSMVKALGVKKGKAHQASEDVRMTVDCLIAVMEPMKEALKNAFINSAYPEESEEI